MKFYEEPSAVVYQGYALDKTRICRAGVIQLFDSIKKKLSFNRFFRANIGADYAYMLSNFLALPKLKKQLGLFPFNPQIGQKGRYAGHCLLIRYAPCKKRFAVSGRWLFYSFISSKILKQKLNDFRFNLLQSNLLGVNRIMSITSYSHSISASFNCEIAVTVKTACQVSLHNFFHNDIISYPVAEGKYL
jgi:hypothetical protein